MCVISMSVVSQFILAMISVYLSDGYMSASGLCLFFISFNLCKLTQHVKISQPVSSSFCSNIFCWNFHYAVEVHKALNHWITLTVLVGDFPLPSSRQQFRGVYRGEWMSLHPIWFRGRVHQLAGKFESLALGDRCPWTVYEQRWLYI